MALASNEVPEYVTCGVCLCVRHRSQLEWPTDDTARCAARQHCAPPKPGVIDVDGPPLPCGCAPYMCRPYDGDVDLKYVQSVDLLAGTATSVEHDADGHIVLTPDRLDISRVVTRHERLNVRCKHGKTYTARDFRDGAPE